MECQTPFEALCRDSNAFLLRIHCVLSRVCQTPFHTPGRVPNALAYTTTQGVPHDLPNRQMSAAPKSAGTAGAGAGAVAGAGAGAGAGAASGASASNSFVFAARSASAFASSALSCCNLGGGWRRDVFQQQVVHEMRSLLQHRPFQLYGAASEICAHCSAIVAF